MDDKKDSASPRLARRRCKVCEWEDEVVDSSDADPDCPWCHAPTELVEIVLTSDGHAAALGRLGGLKGGHARAAALTARQRKEIASKAARARWAKKRSEE